MLERLLAEIRLGGSLTTTILAKRLNTSVEMIDALLDRLVQFGFIKNLNQDCYDTKCQNCSLGGLCKKNSPTGNRLWTLS
jgi:hypothetical protein